MQSSRVRLTAEEVAAYFSVRAPALKQQGGEWRGPCPVHNGQGDNFAVNARTGEWHCHSKCGRGGDVFALEMALGGRAFPEAKQEVLRIIGREPTGAWRRVAEYPYDDENGEPLFRVVRLERDAGGSPEKKFIQERYDRQQWIAGVSGIRRVPYRLQAMTKASKVFAVEGERDVATVERFGYTATCNPGGSGSTVLYKDWLRYFAGKHVVVLPDNDGPGRRHAAGVADALIGVAASVRIVMLPGLSEKGDVTDWAIAGGTAEELRALVDAASPLSEEGLRQLKAEWSGGVPSPVRSDEWPDPIALQSELPEVDTFDVRLLPDAFRPFAVDTAERMQCPVDFVAVALVVALAGAVNRRARIQPKREDTQWVVVPNLWGAIVASPGLLKSPILSTALGPLRRIETEWRRAHEGATNNHADIVQEYELRLSAWKEQFKRSAKKNMAAPDRPEPPPKAPELQRLIVNDATAEALHVAMSENPAGVLVFRDELVGWWSQLDRHGREGERGFCLQAWNGDTSHTIDRIGRGTIHVEACCMSMLGGIQPARLRSYLADALADGPANDGLVQRFQVLAWPDTRGEWRYVDRTPDAEAEASVNQVFRRLVELSDESPKFLRFGNDAQELFVAWLTELERRLRAEELHPAMAAHLAKYRSLMPSLALLFCLADWAAEGGELDCVPLHSTRQAAALCQYLESHARRLYSCVTTPQMRAARELAEKIKARKVGTNGRFVARDAYMNNWSGLDTPERVRAAAEVLQDAGWLRVEQSEPGPLGGRPAIHYTINPKVMR